jgi:two-component system chemotaxis response regulator CheB
VVDDSALMRKLLREVLSQDPELEVVDVAPNALVAWEKIQTHRPDVLTLDVEMPHMDGLSFLEKLMRAQPTPVVMVSTLTEKGCETTLRALELGAVDFVTKPKIDVERGTLELGDVLIEKVKAAARARLRRNARRQTPAPSGKSRIGPNEARSSNTDWVIAIGASTGGTEALRELLSALPAAMPPILVVQHMPEKFTGPFARRLDACCALDVKEAVHGDPVVPGRALIAPGNQHMEIVRHHTGFVVSLSSNAPVHHHRPSVDVLFHSCAQKLGARALGVILTGMGADGALGLLAMRRAGARTVAQDEATSVVFGMPREAIANGSVETIAPLENIASHLLNITRERPARS